MQLMADLGVRSGMNAAKNKKGFSAIHFIQYAQNMTWTAAKSKWYRLVGHKSSYKAEILGTDDKPNVFMIVLEKCGKNQNYMTPGMDFLG